MEELRSTEALDNEIRSETKKKAEKIVEKAKQNAAALIDGVEARIQQAKESALEKSQKEISLYEKNINASLPLEKQRYLISYIHNSILEACNEYLEKIGPDGRFEIIKSMALRVKPLMEGKSLEARAVNIDPEKADFMLEEIYGKESVHVDKAGEELLMDEAVELLKFREGIILQTEDKKIKCSLTLDEKIREILENNKKELAMALFDGSLPQ